MKIKEIIREFSSDTLAQLDVELILAYVLGVGREYLITHDDEELEEGDLLILDNYLHQLRDGRPLAYILNRKEFFSLDFFVDERVLIPRPETEMLVEKVIEYLAVVNHGFKILEVGTGSGNIAVSLAHYFREHQPTLFHGLMAVDISEGALEVAQLNAASHGVDAYIDFFQSDLLEVVEEEYFDVIVANLPYIGESKNRFVSASAEKYEPNVALFGGENGLSLYQRLFEELFAKQVRAGMIVGEFGFAQTADLEKLLEQYFPGKWEIVADLAGIDRIFIIKT